MSLSMLVMACAVCVLRQLSLAQQQLEDCRRQLQVRESQLEKCHIEIAALRQAEEARAQHIKTLGIKPFSLA